MEKGEKQTNVKGCKRLLMNRWEQLNWKDGIHDKFECTYLESLLESMDILSAEEENLAEVLQRIKQLQKEIARGEVL